MKANTVVWIILMLLTVVSVRLSDSGAAGKATLVILTVAGLKFALVGWQFMDLRKSLAMWSVALFGLLGLTLGMIFFLA